MRCDAAEVERFFAARPELQRLDSAEVWAQAELQQLSLAHFAQEARAAGVCGLHVSCWSGWTGVLRSKHFHFGSHKNGVFGLGYSNPSTSVLVHENKYTFVS